MENTHHNIGDLHSLFVGAWNHENNYTKKYPFRRKHSSSHKPYFMIHGSTCLAGCNVHQAGCPEYLSSFPTKALVARTYHIAAFSVRGDLVITS